jgi:hypothetical protein
MSKAAMWAALEALAVGAVREAEAILLSAVEDEERQEDTANPNPHGRSANGWPGEREGWGQR